MRFAWDAKKRAANLVKHDLDLVDGRDLFDGRPLFTYSSTRADEARVVSVGVFEDVMVALVWVAREGGIRLISMRRARDAESRKYRELHG
jgi:uncharacterized DUF497 family protein